MTVFELHNSPNVGYYEAKLCRKERKLGRPGNIHLVTTIQTLIFFQ